MKPKPVDITFDPPMPLEEFIRRMRRMQKQNNKLKLSARQALRRLKKELHEPPR